MIKQASMLLTVGTLLSGCSFLSFSADPALTSSTGGGSTASPLTFSLVNTTGVMKSIAPTVHIAGANAGVLLDIYFDAACSSKMAPTQMLSGTTADISLGVPYGTISLYYKVSLGGVSSSCATTALTYQADFATGHGFPLGKVDQIFGSTNWVLFDRLGNFYVADQNAKPIQKFNSAGILQSRFGVRGSGDGQFTYQPGRMVHDSQGNLFILDTGAYRVQKLTADGAFLSKFGSNGTADGQFTTMQAIAIDASDNVYATDSGSNYIQKFSSNGTFLTKFGGPGTNPGQFTYLTAVAVDEAGNVFATDSGGAQRVHKFDSSGVFVSYLGTTGTGDGQFSSASALVADGAGSIYVSEGSSARVQKFNAATGAFVSKVDLGAGFNNAQFALDPTTSDLLAYQTYMGATVTRFSSTGALKATYGTVGNAVGQFKDPRGIRTDSAGNIYVVDYSNYRIQKFNSAGVYQATFGTGTFGTADGQLRGTYTVAIDTVGNVYVADTGRCQKFDPNGNFLYKFGAPGTADGQFGSVTGIAVDNSGNIYLTDLASKRVEKFANDGTFLLKFGTPGTGDGQFGTGAQKLVLDPAGNVYVVDGYAYRVQKFSSNGVFMSKFVSSNGYADGQIASPVFGIALDTSGNLYIADPSTHRISKFDGVTGLYVSKYENIGEGDGQLYNPTDIAIDSSNNVFVVEGSVDGSYKGGHNRVQKFDLNFNPVHQ